MLDFSPVRSAEISYSPGCSNENRYTPLEFDVAVLVSFVEIKRSVTCAPGTMAPEASVIVPVTSPVVSVCADSTDVKQKNTKINSMGATHTRKALITTPLLRTLRSYGARPNG